MSEADFSSPPTLRVVAPKPKMTIYYALLILALMAMITACIFLYLEIRRFGAWGEVKGGFTAVERPLSTLLTQLNSQEFRGEPKGSEFLRIQLPR